MTTINRTAILPYSCEQLFDLVNGVEHYPQFLPWCRSAVVQERTESRVVASIEIFKMGIHKTFTTCNQNDRPHQINMEFVDGPFDYLHGQWQFEPLGHHDGCKITFHIDYEMNNGILNKAFGGVFHSLANSLVDAFCERAKIIYSSFEKGCSE